MPTLIIRGADGNEQKAELEGELTVGREAGNDVVVADKGVSRRHCRFYLSEEGAPFVEDLGSANGVLIDGSPIDQPTPVRAGMEILIGPASARVEGPPTALAKRQKPKAAVQRGGNPRSTRVMTSKEAPERGRKAKVPASAAQGIPRLLGQGAILGSAFELMEDRTLVGRVPPADIAIDDDSVSRKHAELIRAGDQMILRDLESANGTFVNGERVVERSLLPGDAIRFGVVEFVYAGPAAWMGLKIGKKKALAIAGISSAVVMLAAVLFLAEHGGDDIARTSVKLQGPAAAQPKDPLRELSRCKALSDPENEALDWRKAVEVCGQVVGLDPTLAEARELELRAKREVEYEDLLKNAKVKLSTSQEDMALGMLVKIPTDSTSFNQARLAFKEASERLAKRARSACKTDLAAGWYASAAEKCQKAMEVTCNRAEGVDPESKRLFEHAARSAGLRTAFVCPADFKPFEPEAEHSVDNVAEQQIRAKYSDEPIAELMIRYCNIGKPKQVADDFKRLRANTGRRYPQIDDYIVQFELVDGRYVSGQEGLRREQPSLAWEFWKDAFDADAKLMPAGVRSFMIREMSSQLAALYFKLGSEQYRMTRYSQAAKYIFEGYRLDKSNTDIITLMANWEVLAKRMLDAEPSCESAQTAMDVTLPESSVRKRAEQLREERGCQ